MTRIIYISWLRNQQLLFLFPSQSFSSLRHSPRTALDMQPSIGELPANENTFIVLIKLVYLPSFNILNFFWTSTSPPTYVRTHSVSGQTYSAAIYFLVYARAHTHTHIYINTTWSFFYSFCFDGEHTDTEILRVTFATIQLTCFYHVHRNTSTYVTNIFAHFYFVLTFPRLFYVIKDICLTLWNFFFFFLRCSNRYLVNCGTDTRNFAFDKNSRTNHPPQIWQYETK